MEMFENRRSDRKFNRHCGKSKCEVDPGTGMIIGSLIGAGSSLLGGGGDEQSTGPWEGVQYPLLQSYGRAQALADTYTPYLPRSTFASFSPLQIGGMYGMLDYTQNRFQPGVGSLQGMLGGHVGQQYNPMSNPYQGHYQHMFNAPMNIANNPQLNALKQANESQVRDSFMRKAMPAVRSGAQMAGQYGGSREALASGVAMGDAAEALANANAAADMQAWNTGMNQQRAGAQLMGQGFGQQTSASLDAMRQMPAALQLGFMGPQMAMDIGGMQQNQYQRQIDDIRARWEHPMNYSWQQMNNLTGVLSGNPAQSAQRSTTQSPNILGGALGGAMLGNAFGNAFNTGNTPSLVGSLGGNMGTIYPSGGGYDYLMGM